MIEILLKQFENFVKRALIPSVSFVITFLFIGCILVYINDSNFNQISSIYLSIKITNNVWFIGLILLIGLSFFLSIVHQLIYDNLLKRNFDSFCSNLQKSLLSKYRLLVIEKLKKEDKTLYDNFENEYFTDNHLYQILGRKLSYFDKLTNTKRYVDESKSIGIFFISIILSLTLWNIFYFFKDIYSFILPSIFISLILYIMGFFLIKSKYRSRAIRMYINYLLGEKHSFKITTNRYIEKKFR